jgi:hypothetical protein
MKPIGFAFNDFYFIVNPFLSIIYRRAPAIDKRHLYPLLYYMLHCMINILTSCQLSWVIHSLICGNI